MISLKFTLHFKKTYKKPVRKNPDCAIDILYSLMHFAAELFYSRLETHKLSGDKKDLWSFAIQYDMRMIFGFESENTAIIVNIGSHDEVY